jgi:hypothetical protein
MRPYTIAVSLCWLLFALLFTQCQRQNRKNNANSLTVDTAAINFSFFLSEKTMIVNKEQNNEVEGTYLKIEEIINDSTIRINLPEEFYLNDSNITDWMLGWPTGKAYYDAANENLRRILSINTSNRTIVLGKLLSGKGFPVLNQRIVFWNKNPSGFKNSEQGKVIKPEWWGGFAGRSAEFGAIIFDSARAQWIMYLQEVDTNHVSIYAAASVDLNNWIPYEGGKTFFMPEQFKQTSWAGTDGDGKTPQTARLYSIIYHNGVYHFYLSGYDKQAKRNIGLITATDPLAGPFTIHPQPIISPSVTGPDVNGCFYPKVCRLGNKFLLYYDGVGADGTESVCLAQSTDLINWQKFNGNPVIAKHYGWRSGKFTSEPSFVICSNDSVWLMIGGYKKYNTEFDSNDSLHKSLPTDKAIFSSAEPEKGKHISGNVMDAQQGVFLSTDGGFTFRPHSNNPIWINDYSDTLQNDHLGGDFFYHNNTILYQAKSETQKRYNILKREK